MLLLTFILVATLFNKAIATDLKKPELGLKSAPKDKPLFKDLIKKYEPSTVWERFDLLKMTKKINLTAEEELNYMLDGMDPTDELLRLKVVNGDASVPVKQGRRFWSPAGALVSKYDFDHWEINHRLNELMKQAIYQTRNKLIILQTIRDEYRSSGLYKMGFLTSRLDFRAKQYAAYNFKAVHHCHTKATHAWNPKLRTYFIDIIYTIERSLHIWFEMDLLGELLLKNHLNAQSIVSKYQRKRRQRLTKTFIW